MSFGSDPNSLDKFLNELGIGYSLGGSPQPAKEDLNDLFGTDIDADTMMTYIIDGSIQKLIDQHDPQFHDRLKAIVFQMTQSYSEDIKDILYRYTKIDSSQKDSLGSLANAIKGYIHSARLGNALKNRDEPLLNEHRNKLTANQQHAELYPATAALFAVQLMKLLSI